jgi:hypothetical protein
MIFRFLHSLCDFQRLPRASGHLISHNAHASSSRVFALSLPSLETYLPIQPRDHYRNDAICRKAGGVRLTQGLLQQKTMSFHLTILLLICFWPKCVKAASSPTRIQHDRMTNLPRLMNCGLNDWIFIVIEVSYSQLWAF